jgi:PAS domain S-box-containing protein
MSSHVILEPGREIPEKPNPRPPRPGLVGWVLERVDGMLSPQLRRGSSSQLTRHRMMAGASCFLLVFCILALAVFPLSTLSLGVAVAAAGYMATLGALRWARTPTAPAVILCTTLAAGNMLIFLVRGAPYLGTHAALAMLPAISVYLLGSRRGLFFTLASCFCLGLIYPLYYVHFVAPGGTAPDELFWPLYACAIIPSLGTWGLGSLHSAAQDEARHWLERTLAELRDSQGKLTSLFESTHDLMASLDTEGRLITANSAARQAYLVRFGTAPDPGRDFFPESDPQLRASWMRRLALALTGQRQRFEEVYVYQGKRFTFDTSVNPIHGEAGRITGLTIFARNITARKEAELRLGEMHRTLVEVSRQAGMAEIATGVLHNVGNTLNSINVSTTLVIDELHKSRLGNLGKATTLLQEHADHLASFFTEHPQGQKLPAFFSALFTQLQQEHTVILKEMGALSASVEHIKSIIGMQQRHARAVGTVEQVPVPQLIDEALRLHAISFERLGITIDRDYAKVPALLTDKHRLLQILVNLLSNARDALLASTHPDKRLRISVHPAPEGGRLRIQVVDNGMGIAPESLPHMFFQGFTTKKDGHGFGLHISALAAQEMNGQLTCSSPGLGQGATFTLELPTQAAVS